ncbi:MAG: hypothetical protein M9918_07910 [Anaerolineae bacterium]|nr:hypothetical protein [Anaerolineae bacterium]
MQVAQHIYSNVPREKSPQRRRGYQTLFYTQTLLSRALVYTLEERSQYYTSDSNPVKWQFHTIYDWAVVTRTMPLSARDEFGRKGRYLAHSLLFSAEQFAQLAFSPCTVWSQENFYDALDAVFADGEGNGNIAPRQVRVQNNWERNAVAKANRWPPSVQQTGQHLAWSGQSLADDQRPVILQGTAEAQLETLSILFTFTPLSKRRFLTFDTYALQCDWPTTTFWMRGGITDPVESIPVINCESHTINVPFNTADLTPFERWTDQIIATNRQSFLTERTYALQLEAVLMGDSAEISHIKRTTGTTFAQVNKATTTQRILSVIPIKLSNSAQRQLASVIQADLWSNLIWAATNPDPTSVAQKMGIWLSQLLNMPFDSADYEQLVRFSSAQSDLYLTALLHAQAGQAKDVQVTLEKLDPREYVTLSDMCLPVKCLAVEQLFAFAHAGIWAQRYGRALSPHGLQSVLKRIKKQPDFDADQLLPLVSVLPASDLRTFADWLAKYDGAAPQLHQHLAPYRSPSLKQRLKGFWRGNRV